DVAVHALEPGVLEGGVVDAESASVSVLVLDESEGHVEILLLAGGTVHAAGAEHVDVAQQSAVFVGIVGRGILDEDDVPTLDQSAELLGGGVDGLLGSEGGVGLTLGL